MWTSFIKRVAGVALHKDLVVEGGGGGGGGGGDTNYYYHYKNL